MNFQDMDIAGSTILLEQMLHKKQRKVEENARETATDKKDSIEEQSQGHRRAADDAMNRYSATSAHASKESAKGKPDNIHEAIDEIALGSPSTLTHPETPSTPATPAYNSAALEESSGADAATDSTAAPAYDSFFGGVTKLVTNFKVLFNPTDTLYLEQEEHKEALAADTLKKDEEEKVKEDAETALKQKEEEEKKQHESGASRAVQGIKEAYNHFVAEQLNSKGGK